jgi:hypothetical protein
VHVPQAYSPLAHAPVPGCGGARHARDNRLGRQGFKLASWPGVFLVLGCMMLFLPSVLLALGMRPSRARTLIGSVCMSAGMTLIVAIGFHLVVGALVVGALTIAASVYYTFQGYARIGR